MNDESELATQREQRPMLLENRIGRALSESHANGELRSAPSYGKPKAPHQRISLERPGL